MIRIKVNPKSQEQISRVNTFYDLIIQGKNEDEIAKIDTWVNQYLEEENFKSVVTATPNKLYELKCRLETPELQSAKKELLCKNKSGEDIYYVKDNLYKYMKNGTRDYLLAGINQRVCPYCNRNYIYSRNKIRTCQLDHFFSKDKYPILAVSYYNLIPSCSVCNNKKRDHEFDISPYTQPETDELIQFSYQIQNADFLSDPNAVSIETTILHQEYQKQADKLQLIDLYKNHNPVAFDMIKKTQIFSEKYLLALANEFPDLHLSQTEIERLIFGKVDQEDYSSEPLSKLKSDLYKRMSRMD